MAHPELPQGLKASILDRLIDSGIGWDGGSPRLHRGADDRLGAPRPRRPAQYAPDRGRTPAEFPQVENSIITYGLPDLSSYQSTKADVRRKVIERIEQAIARFEPRLKDVRASLIEDADELQFKLKFEIHATMRVDPSPEVSFVTILKLATGETSIQLAD